MLYTDNGNENGSYYNGVFRVWKSANTWQVILVQDDIGGALWLGNTGT